MWRWVDGPSSPLEPLAAVMRGALSDGRGALNDERALSSERGALNTGRGALNDERALNSERGALTPDMAR